MAHRIGSMRALAGLCLLSLLACGPKSMSVRMRDAERRADSVNHALDLAEKAEADLEVKDAESAREKRDLERRLNSARDKVVPAVQKLSEALDKLSPTAPTREQIAQVEDHAKDVREGVDDAKDMFVKDPDFASWAKSQRSKAEKGLDEVAKAKVKLKFIEGPGAALLEAQKKSKEARTQKSPEDRQAKLQEAKDQLERCVKDGTALSAEPALSGAQLKVQPGPGKPLPPLAWVTQCREAQKGVDAELDKVKKLLAKQAPKKPDKGKKK